MRRMCSLFSDAPHLPLTLIVPGAAEAEEPGAAPADIESCREPRVAGREGELKAIGAWTSSAQGEARERGHESAPALAPIPKPVGVEGVEVVATECVGDGFLQRAAIVDVVDSSECSDADGLVEEAPVEAVVSAPTGASGAEAALAGAGGTWADGHVAAEAVFLIPEPGALRGMCREGDGARL
jgi:hypothetical protein